VPHLSHKQTFLGMIGANRGEGLQRDDSQ